LRETYEEWRLVFDVPVHADELDAVVENSCALVPETVDIHRRDRGDIAVYAPTEALIRTAQPVVEECLREFAIPFSAELKRWNPRGECWQDPKLPVEPFERGLDPAWLDLDELAWEVRLRLTSRAETTRLADELRNDNLAVITDGWRRLTVGVADEEVARALADDLRLRAPAFTRIELRPLSRWRRWLIRQGLVGGYADGGGAVNGDGGGGGNGGGGG
jgi:hypothetical protein